MEPPGYDWLWPVTITPDRYSGTYSGGAWLAFPLLPAEVPDGPYGGDTFANAWWEDLGDLPVGRGDTPDSAHSDLVQRLEAIRPTKIIQARSVMSGSTWTWELRWPSGQVTSIDRSWRGEGRGPQPWED